MPDPRTGFFSSTTLLTSWWRYGSVIILCAVLSACVTQKRADAPPGDAFVQRVETEHFQFRIMSWNVRVQLMMNEPQRRLDDLARITKAVQPDIIILQEIYWPGIETQLPGFMNQFAPAGTGLQWHFHGAADNAVLSRFPLLQTYKERIAPFPFESAPDFRFGQALLLADLPDEQADQDVFVIAMHNKSGVGEENVRLQLMQSDSIISTIRKRIQRDDPLALPLNTPIIVGGDMNVIDSVPALHYKTLLTGDIVDEQTWGPDFPPDWDGTDLADATPSHNALGVDHYTWRADSTPFPPGQFDRFLYTDSVMSVAHGFVLNTTLMDDAALERVGLNRHDSWWNHQPGEFDHLPVVVDFVVDGGD